MKDGKRSLAARFWARLFRPRRPGPDGKIRRRARRYIPPEIGLERFFVALRDRQIRYVLLRWFDDLPNIKPGSDIDLLIHDDDVDKIADLFVGEVRGTPCDLFSASGRRGTTFRGIPYYPPDRANELLARAATFRDLYRIPCPEDHFLSLAYHAVYQKGLRSGLPTSQPGLTPESHPRRDYAADLAGLATDLGIDVPITMEGLDDYLTARGWQPSPHMRPVLAKRNPWISARFRD